jgi:hypothetical protein
MGMPEHREMAEASIAAMASREGPPRVGPDSGIFRREGDYWTIGYQGKTARIKDTKGLRDIASLLSSPGKETHVADLIAAEEPVADGQVAAYSAMTARQLAEAGLHSARGGANGETRLLDARARSEYRSRLAELHSELDEAESANDTGRVAKLKEELDFIADELASAFGLGGRARRGGHPSERARTAVTMRIRYAIDRIRRVHPDLGRHLERSIHTGTFCSYLPAVSVLWDLLSTVACLAWDVLQLSETF